MPSKHYTLTSWANGYGIWSCRVDFTKPLGNTGEAERIKHNAVDAAKRRIRQEISERQGSQVPRLTYHVSDNKIDHMNLMWSITITET